MAMNIFFSHGTGDQEWVHRIKGSIESEEVRFYIYERDSQPGRVLSEKIQKAIGSCDVMVTLLTKRSHSSAYVHEEIGYAKGKGKLVIPLVEKGIPKRSLATLQGEEYVPFDATAIDSCVIQLSAYLLAFASKQNYEAIAGFTKDQWTKILIGLIIVIIGASLIYTVSKG